MFKIYDITNVGAAYFLKWLEKNIDGATQFKSVAPEYGTTEISIEPVQQGLSGGETRQVLLDHYRNDFKKGKSKESVAHLEGIRGEINRKNHHNTVLTKNSDHNEIIADMDTDEAIGTIVDNAECDELTIEDLEEFLYSIDDEELVGMWVFAHKLIYVLEN